MDSDVIPLTTPLVAYWRNKEEMGGMTLKSLEVAEVKEFLRRNLHWRVLDVSTSSSSFLRFRPGWAGTQAQEKAYREYVHY
jgi:hypothetical protein